MGSHRPSRAAFRLASRVAIACLFALVNTACQLSEARRSQINLLIEADGRVIPVTVPAGSTVAEALQVAGTAPGNLDKTEPPLYAVPQPNDTIRLIRVEERFRTEVRTLPFERQVLRNDALPEGEERLVQSGVNGQEELTYRTVLEDGVIVSETIIKSVRIQEPLPEILLIGARPAISSISIPGVLAYLSAGNAWIMDTVTSNRSLVVNTGDLDGRVFALSPDSQYLLYTRRSQKAADVEINTLWAVPVGADAGPAVSLKATNVVHFAGWYPDQPTAVAFTTVEPRSNAPGWQANNDLYKVTIGGTPAKILEAQTGGVYGWWGTSFKFSPAGRLAYTRPDGIGLVSQDGGYLAPVISITPVQTHADWAWSPGIAWATDSQSLYFVDHGGVSIPSEDGGRFDLRAVSLGSNSAVTLVENVGMFAMPSASPRLAGAPAGGFQVAYLQAIFPDESEVSRYRLAIMDRDGSNRRVIFPSLDLPGLDPQTPVWAPGELGGQAGTVLCVIYRGDLWLIDSGNGEARQITSDGLISEVDWR